MSVHTLRATRRSAEVQPPAEDRAEVSLENLVPEIHRPITEEEAATLPPSSTIPGDKRTQSPTTIAIYHFNGMLQSATLCNVFKLINYIRKISDGGS